jgi:hypothetical protein
MFLISMGILLSTVLASFYQSFPRFASNPLLRGAGFPAER